MDNKKKGRMARQESLRMDRQSSQRLLGSSSHGGGKTKSRGMGSNLMSVPSEAEEDNSELQREIEKMKTTVAVLEEDNEALREEKERLIKKHAEEDLLRDEDLMMIQEDIDVKFKKLEKQNKELKAKVKQLKEEQKELGGAPSAPGGGTHGENLAREQRIIELEEELEAARKVMEFEKSDEYLERLKQEVKAYKEGQRDLKRQLRAEKDQARKKSRKKDETIEFLQKEMIKMRKDVEFKLSKQRSQRNLARQSLDDAGMQEMQNLEDEIAHWKGANIELEEDLVRVRSEISDWKEKAKSAGYREDGEEDSDDDATVKSFKSRLSHLSRPLASVEPAAAASNFFSRSPGKFSSDNSTASRGLGLGGLWNKMTAPQDPANPAPYSSGILDD